MFVSGRRGGKATQRPGDRTKGSEREKTLQRGTDNEISATSPEFVLGKSGAGKDSIELTPF